MDEAWERAIEAARGGEEPSSIRSLTLDGSLKCSQGRLPASYLLEQFTQLRVLSIANVNLSSLVDFPSLPHLERLVLSDNRIAGGLEYLVQAGLCSLRDLDLSNNKIHLLEDLAPLEGLNLLSLDLYECPVTRFPEYRSKVFGTIKSLQYLDKLDADNNERPETDEEDEEDDEEDDDVEDELADGIEEEYEDDREKISARRSRLGEEDREGEEDDGEDSDEDDEGGVQHPAVARSNHVRQQGEEESSSEEEVDDEDDEDIEDEGDSDNAEVSDGEESDEEDDEEEEEDEDEEEEGAQQASGDQEGEIEAQGDEEEDDEYGEVGDEDEEEEEDHGMEYLVQPIRQGGGEEAGSGFEAGDEDEDDEDIEDDADDEEDEEPPLKRKREEDGKDRRPSKK